MPNITNDEVDVVVVGLGWAGSLMSIELAQAGLKVRALERGEDRSNADFTYPKPADQYAYGVRNKIMVTPRTAPSPCATTCRAPLCRLASGRIVPGTGVGGSGLHWTGVLIRPTPTDIKLKTYADQAYKPGVLGEGMQIQDYPFTWEEIEPYLDKFDKICGLSGNTGNLQGRIVEGGDPFEGPRSSPFPLPALEDTLNNTMFAEAARKLGYHPFPILGERVAGLEKPLRQPDCAVQLLRLLQQVPVPELLQGLAANRGDGLSQAHGQLRLPHQRQRPAG